MSAKRLTLPARVKALTVPLPAGKHIRPDLDDDEPAVLWLSKTAPPPGLWEELRAAHPTTGLWPLLLTPLDGDASRPWVEGELVPDDMSDPAGHDPADLLSSWWAASATGNGAWPGLAPATVGPGWSEAGATADREAAALLASRRPWRLGLVAAGRGADAPTVAGWDGPANHTGDTAEISAVLRSWEDRFGARVVGLGFAELFLSVAAPPATTDEALRVAAEHLAFCPDNVDGRPLAGYAAGLVDAPAWHFWWD